MSLRFFIGIIFLSLYTSSSYAIYCNERIRPDGEASEQTTIDLTRTVDTGFSMDVALHSTIYDQFVYETKEVEWRWEPCNRNPRTPHQDGYCYVPHEYCQFHYILENPRPISQNVLVTIADKMKLKDSQKETFHFIYDPRNRGLFGGVGLTIKVSSWHHAYSTKRVSTADLNPDETYQVTMDGLW